jgi:hypothetical protein
MSSQELRHLVGTTVTVHTGHGDLHGTLLSCTTRSLWLVDDGEDDVVVPIEDVVTVRCDAA